MPLLDTVIGTAGSLLCAAPPGVALGYFAYLAWARPDAYMALIRKMPGYDRVQDARSEEDWIALGRFGNTLGFLLMVIILVYRLVGAFR